MQYRQVTQIRACLSSLRAQNDVPCQGRGLCQSDLLDGGPHALLIRADAVRPVAHEQLPPWHLQCPMRLGECLGSRCLGLTAAGLPVQPVSAVSMSPKGEGIWQQVLIPALMGCIGTQRTPEFSCPACAQATNCCALTAPDSSCCFPLLQKGMQDERRTVTHQVSMSRPQSRSSNVEHADGATPHRHLRTAMRSELGAWLVRCCAALQRVHRCRLQHGEGHRGHALARRLSCMRLSMQTGMTCTAPVLGSGPLCPACCALVY